eukprot:2735323-Amphidinium_carterae.1
MSGPVSHPVSAPTSSKSSPFFRAISGPSRSQHLPAWRGLRSLTFRRGVQKTLTSLLACSRPSVQEPAQHLDHLPGIILKSSKDSRLTSRKLRLSESLVWA